MVFKILILYDLAFTRILAQSCGILTNGSKSNLVRSHIVMETINYYSKFFFTLVCLWLQLLTYGRRIPFAELFARIDAVDASTIKRVANRFIHDRV